MPILKLTKNYLYSYILKTWIINRSKRDPDTGDRAKVVILNGGGSRSGKTVSIAQVLVTIMENFSDPKAKNKRDLKIIIYRDTLVSARDTFSDIIDAFNNMGLREREPNNKGVMEGDYDKTTSPKPTITYKGHFIEFKGMPLAGKEPRGCDISFINELIENNNQESFYGIIRRTTMLVLADWNPKASVHWAYNMKRFNYFYTTTTYLDNKWLPTGLKADAEAQCPWLFSESDFYLETHDETGRTLKKRLPEDFTLEKWYSGYYQSNDSPIQFDGFLRRRWLKEERPENCKEEDYHKYRSLNQLNYDNGTINRASWLTYGEGINAGQEGAIFNDVTWIDEFPKQVDNSYFGLDYGFVNDPSALVKCGNIGMNMYIEKLCYQRTGTSDLLFDLIERPLLAEERRRYIEANSEQWYDKLVELRQERIKAFAKIYSNEDVKYEATDEATENLNLHIESGLPIESIYIVTDTADVYKGRGTADEQQFTLDLNLKAQQYGYTWKFIKVGSKPIVPRIALMKKFKLHLVKDRDFEIEQQNYCYMKDDAGNPTNIPDKDSKWNHIWDAAGYCVWKFFKFIFPS